jgi:hypothetical protein
MHIFKCFYNIPKALICTVLAIHKCAFICIFNFILRIILFFFYFYYILLQNQNFSEFQVSMQDFTCAVSQPIKNYFMKLWRILENVSH